MLLLGVVANTAGSTAGRGSDDHCDTAKRLGAMEGKELWQDEARTSAGLAARARGSILYKDAVLDWQRVGTVRVAPTSDVAYDFDEITKKGTGARWRK